MFFGIQITPGLLMFAGFSVVLYDAIWTWAFSDHQSRWWYERLQGLLKVGIYAGFVGVIALVAYTPWPVNGVIAGAAITSIMSVVAWLRKREKSNKEKKDEVK